MIGNDYGGKKCVFIEERKDKRVGERRMDRGREFQIEGAEKEKDRRPLEELIRGIVKRC
jgi:hypothetical protein